MGVYDFSEELREAKKELLDNIEEIKKEDSLSLPHILHIQETLYCLECLDIYPLSKLAKKTCRDFYCSDTCLERRCSMITSFIEEIDVAISKEEKVGAIAENFSQLRVSVPNGKTDHELERKIRQNAGQIARIIS